MSNPRYIYSCYLKERESQKGSYGGIEKLFYNRDSAVEMALSFAENVLKCNREEIYRDYGMCSGDWNEWFCLPDEEYWYALVSKLQIEDGE